MSRTVNRNDQPDDEQEQGGGVPPQYLDEVDPSLALGLPPDDPNIAANAGEQIEHERLIGEFVEGDNDARKA